MMAGGAIAGQFSYRDLPRMLRWGSFFYACYFVISFPMIYRLDEKPNEDWPLSKVAFEALAAGMLLLFLLNTATRLVGQLPAQYWVVRIFRHARLRPIARLDHG